MASSHLHLIISHSFIKWISRHTIHSWCIDTIPLHPSYPHIQAQTHTPCFPSSFRPPLDLEHPKGVSHWYSADRRASSPECGLLCTPAHPSPSSRLLPHPATLMPSLSLCLIKVMYLSMNSILRDYSGKAPGPDASQWNMLMSAYEMFLTPDGITVNWSVIKPQKLENIKWTLRAVWRRAYVLKVWDFSN